MLPLISPPVKKKKVFSGHLHLLRQKYRWEKNNPTNSTSLWPGLPGVPACVQVEGMCQEPAGKGPELEVTAARHLSKEWPDLVPCCRQLV